MFEDYVDEDIDTTAEAVGFDKLYTGSDAARICNMKQYIFDAWVKRHGVKADENGRTKVCLYKKGTGLYQGTSYRNIKRYRLSTIASIKIYEYAYGFLNNKVKVIKLDAIDINYHNWLSIIPYKSTIQVPLPVDTTINIYIKNIVDSVVDIARRIDGENSK
jgi:hypothetical protein